MVKFFEGLPLFPSPSVLATAGFALRYCARAHGVVDTVFSNGVETQAYANDVSGLGDVNGDGFDDLAVIERPSGGAPKRANVYFGNEGTRVNAKADGVLAWMGGEGSVASAGDVNGDGDSDIVIGNGFDDTAGVSAGAAYLYLGQPGDQVNEERDALMLGKGFYDVFGARVGSAGDINGDGYSDVAVANSRGGDNGTSIPGIVELFLGGPGAFDVAADATMSGTAGGDGFGSSLGSAGDVNGDGYADLVIGAAITKIVDSNVGKAYLYLGGGSVDATADATFVGAGAFSELGYRVASLGDVNGDGFADFDVSSPGFGNRGKVDVYFGRIGTTFSGPPAATLQGGASDSFGAGLASVDPHSSIRMRTCARAAAPPRRARTSR
jgi:FG-GAP-like repeat/FG-GAP repeat